MKTLAAILVLTLAYPAGAQDAGFQITLGDDYQCVPAPPMVQTDGGWLATDARKLRIDCMLTGAQVELNDWRPRKDVKPIQAGFQWQNSHTVLTLTGALTALLTAYIQNRTARRLPILP